MNLDKLNRQQQEAVLARDHAVLVLAGAGSGKTRVLTTKIARLMEEEHVAPWRILAFTFTNKAAAEMKSRVEAFLGAPADGMWIGTFHSICARLLRREISALGWGSDFTIYDTTDQKTLIKQILKDMHVSEDVRPQSVLSAISAAKNRGETAEGWESAAASEREKVLARAFRRYEQRKKQNNALDFDDLILKGIEVLQNPEVRQQYQNRFTHVFVDEYQDTNHPQYDLIRLFTSPEASLCVVGDADQSIYGWRGADIQNILSFERDYPGARTILLEQNYRSTGHILDAANQLIARNSERRKKNLWTENGTGEAVHFRKVQSEHEEAVLVAHRIREEEKKGFSLSDMAVLYRTNAQSRAFEDIFLREGISYRVIGGLKFYDRAEIKDLIAYMNLVVNPLDDVAFRRVVNQPKRGIGNTTVEQLSQLAQQAGMSLLQILDEEEMLGTLSSAARNRLLSFRDLMNSLKTAGASEPLPEFVAAVYHDTGYEKMLETGGTVEDHSRMENVGSFLDAVATYAEEEENPSLVEYLQNLSLLSDVDKTEDRAGVSLLTIHSAKGLEWPVVFVVGLEEGLFPSKRTIEEGNVEEERRLMYVAMTRAQKKLYLSQADSRRVFGQAMLTQPSRFIEELTGKIEAEETPDIVSRTNVYDRSYTPRSGFADPKLRAEYDRKREQFRQMIQEKKEKENKELATSLRVGDKVRHKKFGEGTVVSVVPQANGDEVTVAFAQKGIKRLNAALAPMKRM